MVMDFDNEETNKKIREQYSQEFIDKLNNSNLPNYNNPEDSKSPLKKIISSPLFIGGSIIFTILIVGLIIFAIIMGNRPSKMASYARLVASSNQSKAISRKYQNMIDSVSVRVHNSNFQVTITGLERELSLYKSGFTEEQLIEVKPLLAKETKSVKEITARLEDAELKEILDRVYLREMLLLIDQIMSDIEEIQKSDSFSSSFKKKLSPHYDSLINVKKAAEKTIIED